MRNCKELCPYFQDRTVGKQCPIPPTLSQEEALQACAERISGIIIRQGRNPTTRTTVSPVDPGPLGIQRSNIYRSKRLDQLD